MPLRLLSTCLATLCLSGSPAAQDLELRWHSARQQYYRGEILELELILRCPRQLRREGLVQPYRQRLGLPLRLRAQALSGLPGTRLLDTPEIPTERQIDTAVNDQRLLCERLDPEQAADGAVIERYRLRRRYLLLEPGPLKIPAAELDYLYTPGFREDFIRGRVPTDQQARRSSAKAVSIEVLPLPEAGRPPQFSGAVGSFSLRASLASRRIEFGQSLQLELWIKGQGDLESFTAPDLSELPGFHLRGKVDKPSSDGRRIRYELLPRDPKLRQVPAIHFAWFDPSVGYRSSQTEPLPFELSGIPAAADKAPAAEASALADLKALRGPAAPRAPEPRPFYVYAILLGPWLGGLGLLAWRRLRPRRARTKTRAARLALRQLSGAAAPTQVLCAYLAARLGCSEAAVHGPELGPLLRSAGLESSRATQAAADFASLLAPRYRPDGPAPEPEAERQAVAAFVRGLEAQLRG